MVVSSAVQDREGERMTLPWSLILVGCVWSFHRRNVYGFERCPVCTSAHSIASVLPHAEAGFSCTFLGFFFFFFFCEAHCCGAFIHKIYLDFFNSFNII